MNSSPIWPLCPGGGEGGGVERCSPYSRRTTERLAQWLEEHEAAGITAVFFAKLDMRLKYAKQFLKLGQKLPARTSREELQRYIAAYVHARGSLWPGAWLSCSWRW